MLIKKTSSSAPKGSEITPRSSYLNRRRFITGASMSVAGAVATAGGLSLLAPGSLRALPKYDGAQKQAAPAWLRAQLANTSSGVVVAEDEITPFEYAAAYNNFYEFGTNKDDPARYAQSFKTDPWHVEVEGECDKPGRYALEDLVKPHTLEERIYRLRCVEAWSMVIPWLGVPLGKMLSRFAPNSKAKYVAFETLVDPEQMPGQRSRFSSIRWPYEEGLRIDEAMHPLTLMAVGMYGEALPPQNGAPMRLVVPWKYGFKSIKSIVKIKFTSRMPRTSWQSLAPQEYGFYANVNPAVSHPRWSQKSERRLPSTLFSPNRIETQKFNGYAEEVASLYAGMNLRRHY